MSRYLFIVCTLALFTCFLNTSCTKSGSHRDTLTYEIKTLGLSYNQCNMDSPDCAHISYSYPVFSDQTATADSLNHIINLLLGVSSKNTLAKTQQTFLAEYATFVKQNPESKQVWFSQTNIDVPYQSNRVVCIGVNMNDYTGGAHGLASRVFSCFDRKMNKVITLKDLFNDANYSKLLVAAEKTFKMSRGLADTANLENTGFWFKDNRFHLNDNFVITNNGLDWLFNPYEVASYADGMIVISLRKEDITPLLNQDFVTLWD